MYCLQHPERYCVSAKSLAAHLTGLAWALEHAGDDRGLGLLQRWLNGQPYIQKPAVPRERGSLTIAGVAAAADVAAYSRELDRWARTTWDAYADLHETAREWISRSPAGR